MDREFHPDAEKVLSSAWYAAVTDLYHTVSVAESTADRIRAAEAILEYSIKLGQSINAPFIPKTAEPEYDPDEEDDDD